MEQASGIFLIEPVNYIRFFEHVFNCRHVINDPGWIQEEATYLGIPCLTMRTNTGRPIPVIQGPDRLCATDNLKGLVESINNEQNTVFFSSRVMGRQYS